MVDGTGGESGELDATRLALAWADADGHEVTTTADGVLWRCSEAAAPVAVARLTGMTVARLVTRHGVPSAVARDTLLVQPLDPTRAATVVVVDPLLPVPASGVREAEGALAQSLRVHPEHVELLTLDGTTVAPAVEVLGGWDRMVRWSSAEDGGERRVTWSQLTPDVLDGGDEGDAPALLLWQVEGRRHEPGRRVVPDALAEFVRTVRPELAYAPTERGGDAAALGGLPGSGTGLRSRRGGRRAP